MIPRDYRDKLCRVCRKPGLTPFASEHVACTRERELTADVKTGAGMPTYPCSNRTCERRCRKLNAECWRCLHEKKLAARPLRKCKKCKVNEIPWQQGSSVCPGCMAPGRPSRVRMKELLVENPFELEAMQMAGECMTRDQIGIALQLTCERVRQIEVAALKKFAKHWRLMFGSSLRDEVDYAVAEVAESVDCD